MAKMNLLDLVQDILSDMNSDEVNSIHDTIESTQVAQIVKSTYFELISGKNWPHLKRLMTLESSTDNTKPVYLLVPENVNRLETFEYNKRRVEDLRAYYSPIKYLEPDDFLRRSSALDNTQETVEEIVDFSGTVFFVKNDRHPEYWTTFDDKWIVCDAYNKDLESTVQGIHSRARGYIMPKWEASDSFVPDLPMEMFPALLAEAKSTAFLNIKQAANQKAEQIAVRQRNRMSQESWRVKGGLKLPNYGRRV